MAIVTQDWNETTIGFTSEATQIGEQAIPARYVNATQMCKANGKLFADWYRLSSTQEFLDALALDMGIPISSLLIKLVGTPNGDAAKQGTWVHREIAIDLARWISVKFRIWTNRKIDELIEKGHTFLESDDESMLEELGIMPSLEVRKYQVLIEARKRGYGDIVERFEKELGIEPSEYSKQSNVSATISIESFEDYLANYLDTEYKFTGDWTDSVSTSEFFIPLIPAYNSAMKRRVKKYDALIPFVKQFVSRRYSEESLRLKSSIANNSNRVGSFCNELRMIGFKKRN